MINDFGGGGLKMIDISSFNKSLKTTRIKKYLDNNNKGKWKIFFDITLKKIWLSKLFFLQPQRYRHLIDNNNFGCLFKRTVKNLGGS